MNGFHPNVYRAACCAIVVAATAAGGCKSTSSGVNNPFLAPDRVAPPSTRTLAPGQAQPYYPGDPLPVMQSSVPAGEMIVAAEPNGLSSSGRALDWGARGPATSAGETTGVGSPWDPVAATRAVTAGVREEEIRVPVDSGDLRFPLPPPVNVEEGLVRATYPSDARMAGALSNGLAETPRPGQTVAEGVRSVEPPGALTPVSQPLHLLPTPQSYSPWRTPDLQAAGGAPPKYGVQPASYPAMNGSPLTTADANHVVAVRLRSVAPPPPGPGEPMPRIRFPGYELPQTASADGFRARTMQR